MKKRKELDALVSNGKIGSGKRITCSKKSGSYSAHELLRHETDSSDMDDFSILQPRRKGRKKHGNRLCLTSVCLSLCQFVLVTTSCLVSGALIWLHIGLREDIDLLRAHLQRVEAGNRNTPEALHVIHSSLKQLDSNVTLLYNDVRKNIVDIENITNEVKLLKYTASSLQASIAEAPAIKQLPKDMHSLSESVANFGSKMTALESNVKELKDQQSNIQTTAQNLSGELDAVKVSLQDVTNSSDAQGRSANSSLKESKLQTTIQEMRQSVNYLQGQVTDVMKSVTTLNSTFTTQLKNYSNVPEKIETMKEALVWINNSTVSQNARLLAIEVYLNSNLSLFLEQLDSDKSLSLKKFGTGETEGFVNRTITEAVLQIINTEVFHNNQLNANVNYLQSLEQTHDTLVLLAALLQKFDQIPKTYVFNQNNATELVEAMFRQAFDEVMSSRDLKIKATEQTIKTTTAPSVLNLILEKGKEENLRAETPVTEHTTTAMSADEKTLKQILNVSK